MADEAETNVREEVNKSEENGSSSASEDILLPGCKSLEQFTQSGFASLMNAIKASNSLPSGSDWDYYSSFPEFQKVAELRGKQVLKLISMVLQHLGLKGNILRRDLEEKFDLLLDANDMILERVNSTLDELAGIKRNPQPVLVEVSSSSPKQVSGSWNRNAALETQKRTSSSPQGVRLITAKNIQRPQIKFKDKIDNRAIPFEPKLKDKPNSLKPLAIYLETNAEGEESFNHPYQYELELFTPKEAHLKAREPVKYRPLNETPLVIVEEPEQLSIMVEDLRTQTEIAVDIENHSYRSYQGFACLIQISTREKDYIVDALTLRHCLHELNEVFTKSNIVKVFHGADHDVEWLQRDFGVYLVNMFDTHQAARLLHFAHLSLAFLLKHYCGISIDKRFQLADWRIRPLPQEMINYAREDTHYLLYIYDRMHSDLITAANGLTNLLKSVIQRSTELCLKRYEKPIFSDDMHLSLLQRTKKLFNNRQLYAMKELTAWRDKVAREEDESTGYVLPNHMLMQIAEILPREMQGILACCNPIPPLVRQHLNALHQMILKAREQPMVKVVTQEEVDSARAAAASRSSGLDPLTSPLLCPHDLSHSGDFRDDLSTLIGDSACKESNAAINNLNGLPFDINAVAKSPKMILKRSAEMSVFGYEAFQEEEDSKAAVIKKLKNLSFTSPFQRYKLVKPFMDYLGSSEQQQPAAGENVEEKEVTDEERINRIREYFLEMSKVAPPPPSQSQNHSAANESVPVKKEKEKILSKQISRKRRQNKNKANGEDVEEIESVSVSDGESPGKVPRLVPIKEETESPSLDTESSSKRKESVSTNSEVESQKKVKKESSKEESASKFDYSKVDYSRFQGGSCSSDGNSLKQFRKEKFSGKVKSKFKWKGRNQSMTYKNDKQRR